MKDHLYKFGKNEVFSARSYENSHHGHIHWQYWKDESGDWNFIRTVKRPPDSDFALPEIKSFYIPNKIMDHIITKTAKERLKKT